MCGIARDLNIRDDFPFKTDWFQGKCLGTFAPLGPWLVPSSCIDDPHNLQMELAVNGEVMQDAATNAMIFDIREQIANLSSRNRKQEVATVPKPDPRRLGHIVLMVRDVQKAATFYTDIVGCDAGPTRLSIAGLTPDARAPLTSVLDGIRANLE
ncbi:MAG: fumarylacetoacetate hydrolase family protein [Alphaproteobacteria bacterium]|nr:fumarylacetoacetate hydrolase family protein [Alphaproteobacteria bacterium]